jgi:hypothetical protein
MGILLITAVSLVIGSYTTWVMGNYELAHGRKLFSVFYEMGQEYFEWLKWGLNQQ